MAVGFRDGDVCYATAAEALDAHYTGQNVPVLISGNTVYSTYFFKDAGVWKINAQTNQGTYLQNLIFSVPSTPPPSCTLVPQLDPVEQFMDGNLLGWGVVAAMAVAWGLKQLGRAAS